jgi:ABC-type uncharacterized transport system auxiliary subunit
MKTRRTSIYFLLTQWFVILGLLTLTGCMSSAGKKYYQLYLGPASPNHGHNAEKTAAPLIDKILMVEWVQMEDIYNDYRLVYRSSPYQLNYYSYHFWIKKPDRVIRDAITGYFSDTNIFKSVITSFSEGDPDLLMKASVHAMEEYDRARYWWVHLEMDIEIRDFKTDKQLLFHSFDKNKRLPQKKVELVPIVISMVLKEELDAVVSQLAQKLASGR